LGLALDGSQLDAAVLRRTNGTLRVLQSTTVSLALSPLSGDPELVGREIRNHLDQAGIRERRCALSIPPGWLLTLHVKLPDLPDADVSSYLQIEAERGFHSGHENLYIVDSRYRLSNGEKYATLLAIPRSHLDTLEKVLKAAQLKPVSFSPGLAVVDFPEKDSADGAMVLATGNQGIDLLVTAGGGIAVLRSLDAAMENEGAQKRIDADLVARELRITLGQLPTALAAKTKTLRLFGRGEAARRFAGEIASRAEAMGLKVEVMDRVSAAKFDPAPSVEIAMSPALALAANWVRSAAPAPELLPPKVTAWQQLLSGKQTSRKLAWAGGLAGAAVAIVCGAFLYQSIQIARLESKWNGMAAKVKELSDDKDQIKKYSPWFDRSFRGLRIMQRLTEAFPDDGSVSAKSLDIRDLSTVTCSGMAKDNQSYIKMKDWLLKAPEISDLKTESLRGEAFTLSFQWEGGASGN
jgi:hypothetical protein